MPTSLASPGSRRTAWKAFSWTGGSPASGGKVTYNCKTALPLREPTFLTLKVTPMQYPGVDGVATYSEELLGGEDLPAKCDTVAVSEVPIEARR
jgi:hypothetical protein